MRHIIASRTTPPSFRVSDLVMDHYRIASVERCTPIMQLLKVEDTSMATGSSRSKQHKIMKIITKVHFTASQIRRELRWFKDERTADGRRAQFLGSESDCFFVYLLFATPGLTLRELLDHKTCQISSRHVREITAQMLKAVQYLHETNLIHTDIRPENVEFYHSDMLQEQLYCVDSGTFNSNRSLRSTKLRLGFYGSLGLRNDIKYGADQYRSPEAVYGWPLVPESDLFSIGCVMVEMIIRQPLFAPCAEGPLYEHEKSAMYSTVIGPFCLHLVALIRVRFPHIFASDLSHMPQRNISFSTPVMEVLDEDACLDLLIADDRARRVASELLDLELPRSSVNGVLNFLYFHQDY